MLIFSGFDCTKERCLVAEYKKCIPVAWLPKATEAPVTSIRQNHATACIWFFPAGSFQDGRRNLSAAGTVDGPGVYPRNPGAPASAPGRFRPQIEKARESFATKQNFGDDMFSYAAIIAIK